MSKVQFTKITSNDATRPLTKSIRIDQTTGEIVKTSGGQLYSGCFETCTVAWEEFGDFLAGLSHSECIMPGVHRKGLLRGEIRTKEYLAEHPAFDGYARGKEAFDWAPAYAKWLVLDFDNIPQSEQGRGMASILRDIIKCCPALSSLDYWLLPSSSSLQFQQDGQQLTGLNGFHAYFKVGPGTVPEQVRDYLKTRLILSDKVQVGLQEGWQAGNGVRPTIRPKYPVDLSVFQASKFLFASGVSCGEGLEQRRGLPVRFNPGSGSESTSPNFSVTTEEISAGKTCLMSAVDKFKAEINFEKLSKNAAEEVAARDGISPKLVRKGWEATDRGVLPGSLKILLDNGVWVKTWRLKLFPEDWHKKTCRDPVDPDYGGGAQNKAVIYSSGGGCVIYTLAHGGESYRVVLDQRSVEEVIDMFEKPEDIEDSLGSDWMNLLLFDEGIDDKTRLRLFEKIRARFGYDSVATVKEEANASAAAAATENGGVEGDGKKALAILNEKYATAEVGRNGSFRVIYRGPDRLAGMTGNSVSWHQQKKDDFLLANSVNSGFVMTWKDGKRKAVPAAAYWLGGWKERKHYTQVAFDLAYAPGEHLRPDGLRCLNMWEGYTTKPTRARPCGASDSVSCFHCFFLGGVDLDSGMELVPGDGQLLTEEYLDSLDSEARAEAETCRYGICKWHRGEAGGLTWWLRHIYECVCDSNSAHALWVIDWLTDVIQNPAGSFYGRGNTGALGASRCSRSRPGTALVVHGEQKGTGKEVVIKPLLDLLGNAGFHTNKMDNISGKFNAVMECKVLVFADEATWGTGKEVKSALKGLVTGDTLVVEPKGIDSYDIKSFVHLYVSSNNEQAIPAEEGERRYAIFRIKEYRKGQLEGWFYKFVNQDLSVLLDEMLRWKIKSNLKAIPETSSLQSHKDLHMSKNIDWVFWEYVVEKYEAGEPFLWDPKVDGVGARVCYEMLQPYFEDGGFHNFRHEGRYVLTWNEFKVRLRRFFEERDLIAEKVNTPKYDPLLRKKARHFVLKPFNVCCSLIAKQVGS